MCRCRYVFFMVFLFFKFSWYFLGKDKKNRWKYISFHMKSLIILGWCVCERPCLLELYNLLYKQETGARPQLTRDQTCTWSSSRGTLSYCALYYLSRENINLKSCMMKKCIHLLHRKIWETIHRVVESLNHRTIYNLYFLYFCGSM